MVVNTFIIIYSSGESIRLKKSSYRDMGNAFQYLMEMGHKRIVVQGFNQHYNPWFEEFKRENGDKVILDIMSVTTSDNFVYGYQLAERWLNLPRSERCTALMANNQVCFGFMHKLHEESVSIPDEISLIAGADTEHCKWSNPSLTVINTATYNNARIGTEILIDLVEKSCDYRLAKRRMQESYQAGQLVIRGSSGPAPAY